MTTTTEAPSFDQALAITSILQHPKNPRHKAVADPEMVESVRTQGVLEPLIVAPHPDKPDKFILIAGHRRLDALKKAKLKTAPTLVRRDLRSEAQQIEAMVVENSHRQDLTPIEEAEAFEQLELLGYKPQAIATAVGRNVTTVRGRLKLLKLSKTTKKKVHEGQLNLEDAVALIEFAGDPEATKRLEKAAASTYAGDLPSQLAREKRFAEKAQANAAELARLLEAGATEVQLQAGENLWTAGQRPDGPVPLGWTPSTDWEDHPGCLGYVEAFESYSGTTLTVVCTDKAKHGVQEKAARSAIDEQHEKEKQEREARAAARADAGKVRVASVLDLVGTNTVLPPQVADLVRVLLPGLISELFDIASEVYQDAAGVLAEDRWRYTDGGPATPDTTRWRQHVEEFATLSEGQLTRRLVAVLLGRAEADLTDPFVDPKPHEALAYLDLLHESGHPFSEVDVQLKEAAAGAIETTEEVAS